MIPRGYIICFLGLFRFIEFVMSVEGIRDDFSGLLCMRREGKHYTGIGYIAVALATASEVFALICVSDSSRKNEYKRRKRGQNIQQVMLGNVGLSEAAPLLMNRRLPDTVAR